MCAAGELLHLAGSSQQLQQLWSLAFGLGRHIMDYQLSCGQHGSPTGENSPANPGRTPGERAAGQADFRQATADNVMAARESYVRALDALNMFLRSVEFPGGTGQNE